jgi:hypothetical protein
MNFQSGLKFKVSRGESGIENESANPIRAKNVRTITAATDHAIRFIVVSSRRRAFDAGHHS